MNQYLPKIGSENNVSGRSRIIHRAFLDLSSAVAELDKCSQLQEKNYQESQQRLKDIQKFLWTTLANPIDLPDKEANTDEYEKGFQRGQRAVFAILAEVLGYGDEMLCPANISLEVAKYV